MLYAFFSSLIPLSFTSLIPLTHHPLEFSFPDLHCVGEKTETSLRMVAVSVEDARLPSLQQFSLAYSLLHGGVWQPKHGSSWVFQEGSHKTLDQRAFWNSCQSQFNSAVLVCNWDMQVRRMGLSLEIGRKEMWPFLSVSVFSSLHQFFLKVFFQSDSNASALTL